MEYRAFEERSARGGGVRWRLEAGGGRSGKGEDVDEPRGGEDISKIEY